ncbi:MAG TPA: exopolysaccharide biosynthesis polyprenyl glycosylphosphotransferase [Phycisphaerae bacterium]|nr:exopolysaccharide biosynthesis polyprenyl glycosylphosphotransferase [Phycisphaerae bacterium]HNU46261.1 exopolysaccharide biosynthesis polyprenyl glycosylphosphotransferase [Phycisphaerae bacterium]
MSADCAIGVKTPSVAVPALGDLRSRAARVPRSVPALARRFARAFGQTLVRMDPSTWLLLDIALLWGSLSAAFRLIPPSSPPVTPHVALWQAFAIFAFAQTVASAVLGLYERDTLPSRSRILTRVGLTAGTVTVLAYAIIYVVMYATIGRRIAAAALGMYLVASVAVRLWANWAVHNAHRTLLVVGPPALWDSFRTAQQDGLLSEYRLVGWADLRGEHRSGDAEEGYRGTVAELLQRSGHGAVTDIVVGVEAARDGQAMRWLVPWLQAGCRVTNEATFYEKATGQILVDELTPAWFLFADLKVHCEDRAKLKRVTDLVSATLGLLLSAPLWPLIALAIKLSDGGPVWYAQDRVGQNGKLFKLYKFRTMRPNAENGKSVWATRDDPRVTRVGRWLRRTRLDELPQLYNILIGQMSIVGPRPERPDIVAELSRTLPYYAERHLVKPGLTGWAQISFRYGASVADAKRKLQFDLYYLKHMSFELDLIILLRTVGTFLRGAC